MGKPVCELCGGSDFLKEDDRFTCQGCGTKYTVEEARRLMRDEQPFHAEADGHHPHGMPEGHPAVHPEPRPVPHDDGYGQRVESVAAFQPQVFAAANQGARGVNNYVCQGWQLVMQEYKNIEHPQKAQLDELASRARECLLILDNAAMLEPDNHVAGALIYANCVELEKSVKNARYYEQREDGSWDWHTLSIFEDVSSGQNWEKKRDQHREFLETEYATSHPQEWAQRGNLQREAADIQADLDALKDEKRGKGFFNFSEKREVKDRMKPVKEKLSNVRGQISAIDSACTSYVNSRVAELGTSYVILDF